MKQLLKLVSLNGYEYALATRDCWEGKRLVNWLDWILGSFYWSSDMKSVYQIVGINYAPTRVRVKE